METSRQRGQRERGQSSWLSRQQSANPEPGGTAVPKCSTAPHQSFPFTLTPTLHRPAQNHFLLSQPPSSHSSLVQKHPFPPSKQRQEASRRDLAANHHPRAAQKLFSPQPPGRGQPALTVRQEVHPLSQALEVSVPQGCLRRNPAFGFVLRKVPETGNYTQSARARWHSSGHRGPVQGVCTFVHLCTRKSPSNFICRVGDSVSERRVHHGGVQAITSTICMCTRDSTHCVTMSAPVMSCLMDHQVCVLSLV